MNPGSIPVYGLLGTPVAYGSEGNPFIVIPQDVLDRGYHGWVHVKGWTYGAVFRYLGTRDGVHLLKTPKGGKEYRTSNDLLYTRQNQP